jgi:hypothetical protein
MVSTGSFSCKYSAETAGSLTFPLFPHHSDLSGSRTKETAFGNEEVADVLSRRWRTVNGD